MLPWARQHGTCDQAYASQNGNNFTRSYNLNYGLDYIFSQRLINQFKFGFLYNVQLWYYARHAETFAAWKTAVDGCGNNLLDHTCVPFLTEVTQADHSRSNMAAMLIGGKSLGFKHGRYVTGTITINQLWGTIAQAFGYTSTAAPFAAPVDGFWAKP